MDEYEYRGYPIEYNSEGNYEIDFDDCVMEFVSYEEATAWIDSYLDSRPVVHTYHVSYVTQAYDRGYDEFIEASSKQVAIKLIKSMHPDLAYIADIYEI